MCIRDRHLEDPVLLSLLVAFDQASHDWRRLGRKFTDVDVTGRAIERNDFAFLVSLATDRDRAFFLVDLQVARTTDEHLPQPRATTAA